MATWRGASRRPDASELLVAVLIGAVSFIVPWVTLTGAERRQAGVEILIVVIAIIVAAAAWILSRTWARIRFARRCIVEERAIVTQMRAALAALLFDLNGLAEGAVGSADNEHYQQVMSLAGRIKAIDEINDLATMVADAIYGGVFRMAEPAATIDTIHNADGRCTKALIGYKLLEERIGWFKR